ncbi:hypothetical protein WMY93_033227 [Mugilogobius chulae]|uniref:Uncharacterized protein n=1 Tax=Mugilogobius chulae TaxID=88201 RepID=A0AAW0MTE0_9GOBI
MSKTEERIIKTELKIVLVWIESCVAPARPAQPEKRERENLGERGLWAGPKVLITNLCLSQNRRTKCPEREDEGGTGLQLIDTDWTNTRLKPDPATAGPQTWYKIILYWADAALVKFIDPTRETIVVFKMVKAVQSARGVKGGRVCTALTILNTTIVVLNVELDTQKSHSLNNDELIV